MAGYGTDPGFTDWLASMGYSLPADAPAPAVLRQRGSDYIDALYGSRLCGHPVSFDQERAWPRVGAVVNGRKIPSDIIPNAFVIASYYAAWQEATNPGSLTGTGSASSAVVREKVGELEVQYANAQSDGTASFLTPLISTVDGMLAPYLCDMTGITPVMIRSIGR